MFGLNIVTDRCKELQETLSKQEADSLRAEIAGLKEYIRKCEALIEHERNRIDGERERADRLNDALLAQNGMPVVSPTGRREEEEIAADRKEKETEYLRQLAEISQDSSGNMYDELGVELPPEFADAAKELMKVN